MHRVTGRRVRRADLPADRPVRPAVSVDLSRVGAAGDKLLTAAMLCTWAYGFGMADAAAALAELGTAPRRAYLGSWTSCGGRCAAHPAWSSTPTRLTRLNRAKGMASIMITHSLADLDALATEEDRAKARGFADRCAITVLAGLPPRELARVREITPLTGPEQELVTSWSAPGLLAARRPPPRPRQVPDQGGAAAGNPGRAQPRRTPSVTCTTPTRRSACRRPGAWR